MSEKAKPWEQMTNTEKRNSLALLLGWRLQPHQAYTPNGKVWHVGYRPDGKSALALPNWLEDVDIVQRELLSVIKERRLIVDYTHKLIEIVLGENSAKAYTYRGLQSGFDLFNLLGATPDMLCHAAYVILLVRQSEGMENV